MVCAETSSIYKEGFYARKICSRFNRKRKNHLHRLIGCFISKSRLQSNIHVHHIDGDKMNNEVSNLEFVDCATHLSRHNKGKPISESIREAIIKFNHSRKGKRNKTQRRDVSPEMVYKMKQCGLSFNAISKALKLDWSCVKQRYNDYIHDNPELMGNEHSKQIGQ